MTSRLCLLLREIAEGLTDASILEKKAKPEEAVQAKENIPLVE